MRYFCNVNGISFAAFSQNGTVRQKPLLPFATTRFASRHGFSNAGERQWDRQARSRKRLAWIGILFVPNSSRNGWKPIKQKRHSRQSRKFELRVTKSQWANSIFQPRSPSSSAASNGKEILASNHDKRFLETKQLSTCTDHQR